VQQGTLDESAFDAELASVRTDIAALRLSAEMRDELTQVMFEQFGEPGTYGVFVRSDTNVEDLPQFTGAGLNETLPNIVPFDEQLIAIPRVWSSVLSPRALAWRSSVLANPEQIYASVLLMKSVPSTKSGVLVTRNLFERDAPALTVSAAWGVGGAVAGEAAETIVIKTDSVEVVSEAKSPYQRHIAASGGVDWLPAPIGRVLMADEIRQLRELASEVNEKYAAVYDDSGNPRPWDIEFGFVDGDLTLFQIRPLVERGGSSADELLRQHRPGLAEHMTKDILVNIDESPDGDTT
jgi:phosphoenolpyruvate synthase/pyruvate phosphate dikinase